MEHHLDSVTSALSSMKSKTHTTLTEQKIVHEWTIDNFDAHLKLFESKPDEFISTNFSTNQNKQHWLIELRSKQVTQDSHCYVLILSFILAKNKYKQPIKYKCEFNLEGMDKGEFIPDNKYRITEVFEVHKYIRIYNGVERKIEDFLIDVPNVTRKIVCTLTIYEESTELTGVYRPKLSHPIVADLKKYYETKDNSDITFIVDNTEIKAHKFILMNRSSVFLRMFEIDMTEKRENKVIIKDASPETFNKMLKFLYTDQIEEDFDEKDAIELLALADKYQVDILKKTCGSFLCENLTVENAVKIYLLADQYCMKELSFYAKYFILSHRMLDILNPEILKNHPQLLTIFVKDF